MARLAECGGGDAVSEPMDGPLSGGASAGRILVIDDEEMVRRLARAMLTKLGYEVVLASDGAEGIEIYRQSPESFDAVLLDMIMPKMDGHECFLQLKAINPGVRAVLSSGFSQEGSAQRVLDDGGKGFVQKPYRLQEIGEAIHRAIGKS